PARARLQRVPVAGLSRRGSGIDGAQAESPAPVRGLARIQAIAPQAARVLAGDVDQVRGVGFRLEKRRRSALVDGEAPRRGLSIMASRMLVTMALPYANGSLHLGHMVEAVQTDVFVRAMNAMGREAVYICADDTHGTPIEIGARKAGVRPEAHSEAIQREEEADYKAYGSEFALFTTTHSQESARSPRRL